MINFLKRIWRKIFRQKTGGYDSGDVVFKDPMIHPDLSSAKNQAMFLAGAIPVKKVSKEELKKLYPQSYDPSLDEEKILKGESESYFD